MAFRIPPFTPLPKLGNLTDIPFSELLYRAARERKFGVLQLRDEKVEKAFLFQNGLIVESRSNLPGESFAKLSVVRGKATRESVEGLGVPLLNDSDVRNALVKMKILTREVLEELLRYQLLFRISDVFTRTNMEFEWATAEAVAAPIFINPYQMFSEGIARSLNREQMEVEASELWADIPRFSHRTVFSIDGASLPPRAAQLFRRVDGRTSFTELVDGVNLTVSSEQVADSTYRSWVYLLAFLEGGFIVIGPEEEESSDSREDVEILEPEVEAAGTVMVVTEAGASAVAYTEIDDSVVNERFEMMKIQNFFEVLSIAEDVSDNVVKKAYFKLAKEFHPDKLYNHQARTVKKNADKAFSLVNRAYEQLKTAEGRKQYSQKLKELSEGLDLDKEAESLLRAEIEFQKGVIFLRKKDFDNAVKQFRVALDLNPRESDHLVYCGWAEFQVSYPDNESAWKAGVAQIEQGLKLNPKSHDAMYFLGTVARLNGDIEGAANYFNKVLKFRPNHIDAQRDLRLIEQRKTAAGAEKPKDKNLLGKLIK